MKRKWHALGQLRLNILVSFCWRLIAISKGRVKPSSSIQPFNEFFIRFQTLDDFKSNQKEKKDLKYFDVS